MKHSYNIYNSARSEAFGLARRASLGGLALLLFAACSDELAYSVGEAAGDIVVYAGIADDPSASSGPARRAMTSRALTARRYVAFQQGTEMATRFDGKWMGKGFTDNLVQKTSTGLILAEDATTDRDLDGTNDGDALTDTRSVTFAPALHWDDYGTADPNNTEGRAEGITIYAAAVDGETTAPTISSWTAHPWELVANQTTGWAANDLLTSNNIKNTPSDKGFDGRYCFDDLSGTPSNLLKFTHAMTKVTVVLTAGKGFPGYTTSPNDAKFETAPTVTLKGFYYTGNVDIENKTSTATTSSKENIQMHLAEGGAAHTATFDALVFPGNAFDNTADILSLTADGNTYTVTAAKLNAAIEAAITAAATTNYPGNDRTLLQGWNYKLQITVNKTDIKVAATIVDWNEVEAAEEAPKINIDYAYGHEPGTDFGKGFDLYRSTTVTGSYLGTGDHAVVSFADSKYTMSPQLYWPNHSTHYFFRGVWPLVGTSEGPASTQVKDGAIDVANAPYQQGHYPSDLMIGRPLNSAETAADEDCKVHSGTKGICATEGDVRMNFRYVMSQVEVELKSVTGDAAVKLDKNTKVEIVNVYNAGSANFSDGSVTPTGDPGNYVLNNVDGDANDLKRRSAIVPQDLTYSDAGAATNVRFKITVTNDDSTTDVYYADVNPILKSGSATEKVAPNGKWESGTHYKYVLTLSKTGVNVTATLTDWIVVSADVPTWF